MHKVPLPGQLAAPDDRLYYNSNVAKPERKLKTVKVTFGKLTKHNKEQFRVLNYLTLPVVYSEDFYDRLTNYSRYSNLAYIKDVLVGAISCRYEENEEFKGMKNVYVMTITILKPYRRYGIGTQLLEKAIEECKRDDVKQIYLHVHSGNQSAIEFYTKNGFTMKEEIQDYYQDLEPAGCQVLVKVLN